MTWTAPGIDRRHEPYVADERTMLEGWLDHHRDTLVHPASTTTRKTRTPT